MPDGRPLRLSVVVPTYGRPDSIRRCLAALARLEYPPHALEVLVVDDASPEPVELEDHALPGTLRVIRAPRNRGPAAARNLGAREATGEVLLFTDDDCRPDPEWAAALARRLHSEPDALVGGATENALRDNVFAQASQDLVAYLYEAFDRSSRLLPFFTSNNIGMRRDRYLELGGFDESFRLSAGEDRDFSERWSARVGPLRFASEARVHHYHDLEWPSFLRQHWRYGRGAVHLARLRATRGQPRPRPEGPVFYFRMLRHPLRRQPLPAGVAVSSLIAVAQVSGLAGMAAELLRPRNGPHGEH